MTLSVLVFQHDPYDGPGYLGEALVRRGGKLDIARLDEGETAPDPSNYDMLLVMGGGMNVYAEDQYPWLVRETKVIRQAADEGKAVLGICLGGQLLAKALDARVHLGTATEIGLIPIVLTEAGKTDPLFESLPQIEAVEWHDDTFDIPSGAIALACSEGCANQAFRFGKYTYGLQFHPEVSPEMLANWIEQDSSPAADTSSFLHAVTFQSKALQAQADRLIENFLSCFVPDLSH